MNEKCGQEIHTTKRIKKVVGRSIFILSVALLLFLLSASVLGRLVSSRELRNTKIMLNVARAEINGFKEITGHYPGSLDDIKQYTKENPGSKLTSTVYKEFLSDATGRSKVYSTLNNKGGWYYNPNIGEVKVNLDKPVKEYLFFFGPERNQIPSKW